MMLRTLFRGPGRDVYEWRLGHHPHSFFSIHNAEPPFIFLLTRMTDDHPVVRMIRVPLAHLSSGQASRTFEGKLQYSK